MSLSRIKDLKDSVGSACMRSSVIIKKPRWDMPYTEGLSSGNVRRCGDDNIPAWTESEADKMDLGWLSPYTNEASLAMQSGAKKKRFPTL